MKGRKKEEIIIKHPLYGHVVFYSPTPRQREVLIILQEQMASLQSVKLKLVNELVEKGDGSP